MSSYLSRLLLLFIAVTNVCAGAVSHATNSVSHMTTDGLSNPLGIGIDAPAFSWQLTDGRSGARQTAYRIFVATDAEKLSSNKADVWDSTKIVSDQSVNVVYAGPQLKPQQRYWWKVQVWDADGKAYPLSGAQWWETGLAGASSWTAQWISAETPEHKAIRESNADWIWTESDQSKQTVGLHAFRLEVSLKEQPEYAALFSTAKDSVSAWVNGRQIITAQPLTAWKNMPWGTYQRVEITNDLRAGHNVVAIGATLFEAQPSAMSAVLLWRSHDGKSHLLRTGDAKWRGSDTPENGWTGASFDDAKWKKAVVVEQAGGATFGRPWPADSVNVLKQSFKTTRGIKSARLYATALGAYSFELNGKRVGDQILAPGWTDYRQRIIYQTYDVTKQLISGNNLLSATLAPGWYSTPLMWLRQPYNYGNTPPALRAQLRIDFEDGSSQWIVTDGSWQSYASPVLKAEIYDGEDYDARLELPRSDLAATKKIDLRPVDVVEPKEMRIVPQTFEPIREDRILTAVKVTTPTEGVSVYDFGQNLAGVARIKVRGPAGTRVRLRFAEILNPDGTIYTENLRSAKATDSYTLKGGGVETFEPEFTFHGFRYVELTGLPGKIDASTVVAVAFHTAAPLTAHLETGSPMINKLWSNIEWGQRSNFVGVPTDCPQRDERLGWTADAQVFWRTASYNMDLETFTRKYAGDLRGTAGVDGMFGIYAPGVGSSSNSISPGWSDAGVVIPWTGWLQYSDSRVAADNWDAMARYLEVIEAANPDHLWRNKSGIGFGDWLAPGNKTSNMLAATAYWAYDAQLMVEMAHALGKTAEEQKYSAMFDSIRQAFQQRYIGSDGNISGGTIVQPSNVQAVEHATAMEADDGKAGEGTQTGYALALYMKLVPEALRQAAAEKMVKLIHQNDDMLGTGFLGTPYILAALADTGHADLSYKLLLNTRYPSWGYQVEHGATTMWERWNGDKMMNDPGMNSFNHYAYGAVAAWLYEYAAGIDATPDDPGYHQIYLHPHFSRTLGSMNFRYESPYGEVKSMWNAGKSGAVMWRVVIPANASGYLMLSKEEAALYKMDGQSLKSSEVLEGGMQRYEVAAGTHTFSVAIRE